MTAVGHFSRSVLKKHEQGRKLAIFVNVCKYSFRHDCGEKYKKAYACFILTRSSLFFCEKSCRLLIAAILSLCCRKIMAPQAKHPS